MTAAEIVFVGACGALAVLLLSQTLAAARKGLRLVAAVPRRGLKRKLLWPVALVVLAGAALVVQGRVREEFQLNLGPVLLVLVGLGVTWTVANLLSFTVDALLTQHDISAEDNLAARRIHTQYRVLLRIALILVWVVGAAVVLSTFPAVRALGTGLLASAGIVGLVLGLAAQRTIGNFLAGIQIALTQPIRLDDAVVIAGEWGWVEEITTTYVVVKVWDERRLIVPFSTLLEQPFQNWTRNRADLLGTVTLWTDYQVPIAALREELHRVLGESDLWDGRVGVLQVVEAGERSIQLRILASASSSPRAWDLRCHVREKIIGFLAAHHPTALPTVRAELETPTRRHRRAAPVASDATQGEPELGGLPGEPDRPAE